MQNSKEEKKNSQQVIQIKRAPYKMAAMSRKSGVNIFFHKKGSFCVFYLTLVPIYNIYLYFITVIFGSLYIGQFIILGRVYEFENRW